VSERRDDLGVEVPPLPRNPPRVLALIASAIWLLVSLPFFYLAYLYWNWPQSLFSHWRGWIFAAAALACIAMATLVPPRYRIAVAGTRLRAWARVG
jgi:hypothetical protein